jgi:CDP-diacylglycerol--glycerol-3-phosphate 3-phosphatidyltransferase
MPRGGDGRGAVSGLLAIAAAAVSVVAYRGVLAAAFWRDDFTWMYLLRDAALAEFLLTPSGGHTLVARNGVWALLDRMAGFDPAPYFALVLVTHAVNVLLLHRLVRLLTGSIALAGACALAWGLCPAAAATLSWFSMFGHVAATTCLLAAFGRVAGRVGSTLRGPDLVVVAGWLALASLFFAAAVAVAAALPLAVALLFPEAGARRGALAVAAAIVLLYVVCQAVGVVAYGAPLAALGAARWLVEQPATIVRTLGELVRVGTVSLVLGAWWRPGPEASVGSWLVLLATVVGWAAALATGRAPARRALLACTVLALAVYAVIAIARGPLDGTLLGHDSAEIGATLRYHYAAQVFVVAALGVALGTLGADLRSSAPAAAVLWSVVLLAGWLRDGIPIDRHDASRAEVARALEGLRTRVAGASPGETVRIDNARLDAFGWMPDTTLALPGLAALFVIVFPGDQLDGRSVRFVEANGIVHDVFVERGGRLGHLLEPAAAGALPGTGGPD